MIVTRSQTKSQYSIFYAAFFWLPHCAKVMNMNNTDELTALPKKEEECFSKMSVTLGSMLKHT